MFRPRHGHLDKFSELIKNKITSLIFSEFNKDLTVLTVNAGLMAKRRLACLGIIPGVCIIKRKSAPFHGPIEIMVKGSSIVLGRGLAAKIIVKDSK